MKYFATMTTYPARFDHALIAIDSINKQSIKPKALVINIAEEDFRAAEKDFINKAKFIFNNWLIINKCINLKPANKIVHTAKEHGDNVLVSFDDDVIYPNDRAAKLLAMHQKFPDHPIAYRTREVQFDGEKVKPYSSWPFNKSLGSPKKTIFPTSVSGSLYPSDFFSEEFFDIDTYIKLSHNNDDIWTYFHVLLQGSEFVAAGTEPVPTSIDGSQKSALWKTNVSKNTNDKIISALEKRYGALYNLTNDYS